MATASRLALVLVLSTSLGPAAFGSPAPAPTEEILRDVEAAFRGAVQMWAYREFWRLWEVSTRESRFTTSQDDFSVQMEKGSVRPAAGRQVEDLQVSITSPQTALVVARIGLEDPRSTTPQSVVRSFLFFHQDGRWRPQLSDFLGLSAYTFPAQPVPGPAILVVPCCPVRGIPHRAHRIIPKP